MDDLLPKLLAFPQHPPPPTPLTDAQYDEAIKAQITAIKSIPDGKLLQRTAGNESVLEFLDPATHTIAYAYTLLAQISIIEKGTKSVNENIWQDMCAFLGAFDPRQIRYLSSELSQIIDTVASFAQRYNQPGVAVVPIRDALLRYDSTGAMLTSKHVLLVRIALGSRQLADAVPLLDRPILYFPGAQRLSKLKPLCDMTSPISSYITVGDNGFSRKLKYQEVLEYFLCRGIIYIGVRDWRRAFQSLEDAVTFPTKDGAVSKIMIDAYKKWILVGLLLEGKPLNLPKVTGAQAAKTYHTIAKPYESVAQIFENGTAARLKAEVEAGNRIWHDDCNTGLILHVLSAYQKCQIRNLVSIYTKMSIQEVHNYTTSAETGAKLPHVQATEALVRSMISDGSLQATVNSGGIVSFDPTGSVLEEQRFKSELAESTGQVKTLTAEIRHTDHMLTHDKDYIRWLQKQKKTTKNNGVDFGFPGGDMDWNGEEEDLMAGAY